MPSRAPILGTWSLLLLVACGDARRDRELPLHRLADELAAARGLTEAPAAAVDDVTRYVLTELPIVSLRPREAEPGVEVAPDGTLEVPLACPEALAGRRLVATLDARVGMRNLEDKRSVALLDARLAEQVRCPASGEPSARVRLGGLEPGMRIFPSLAGYEPPAPRVDSPWLTLPPDATLRFTIGIASPRPVERRVACRFAIRAEDRSGRSLAVFEHTLDPARQRADRPWMEFEVRLDGVRRRLGPELRLSFETEPVGPPGLLGFPAWGDPVIAVPARRETVRRPNVILVSLDALRADRLGCYGFPQPTSPNLDRLATQGTLFEQAIAQADWTIPSHATMLTGVYPCVHGKRIDGGPRALGPGLSPLAQILRREGYVTAALTEDGYMDPVIFQRGFGLFRANTKVDPGTGAPLGLVEDTFANARAWLEEHASDEFFLFLHTYQVHAPYTPPPRYRKLIQANGQSPGARGPAPSAEAAEDAALYAAEIRYVDDWIGRFLADLDALRLAENTIVIVTSDHGEAFGEHGRRFHAGGLYEEEVHVPLLWRASGLIAAGRRVPHVVGLVDIVPTVLDLLGIASPAWLQGLSLRPFMTPAAPAADGLGTRVLPSENGLGRLALRGDSWKAMYDQPTPRFFLLTDDPDERSPQEWVPPFVEQARVSIEADCARARSLVAEHGGTEPAPQTPAARDADRERKLRALGYVD